jgi:hypothetical protein
MENKMFILYKEILTTETSQEEVDSQILSEENNIILNPPDLAESKVKPMLIGHNAIVYGSLCMAFPDQMPFRVVTEDDHEDSDWDGLGEISLYMEEQLEEAGASQVEIALSPWDGRVSFVSKDEEVSADTYKKAFHFYDYIVVDKKEDYTSDLECDDYDYRKVTLILKAVSSI